MTRPGLASRLAVRAVPLLRAFNEAGVLSAADVHVAQRLGRLAPEADERVLLAVALAVRAVRAGSVCVRLDDLDALAVPEADDAAGAAGDPLDADAAEATAALAAAVAALPWPESAGWEAAVRSSRLVADGVDGPADRPVRWIDGRCYLDRYWRDEQLVRELVDARLAALPAAVDLGRLAAEIDRLFPGSAQAVDVDHAQRLAAATAVVSRFTVLTGGPGTGKTTTVARVLAVLQSVAGPGLRVALAAPTGKAAARLQEAVRGVLAGLDAADQVRVGRVEATTVHRLLGFNPRSSTRFKHDRRNRLPHDVVVVDETSMVSLPLMARLLEALRPQTRLVLVGDPDQLASVEAGAVLGDLVARTVPQGSAPEARAPEARAPEGSAPEGSAPQGSAPQGSAPPGGVVRLTRVYRYGEELARFAEAIRIGRADLAIGQLRAGTEAISFVETAGERATEAEVAPVRADATRAGIDLVIAARAGDAPRALAALDSHRLLLAHRRGPAGVAVWAATVEAWVRRSLVEAAGAVDLTTDGPWYPGRPLLVTANDHALGLYNGDTGVLLADAAGGVVAAFGDPAQPQLVRPHRLPSVETVYAMTVHRGQGSQFTRVSLILPPPASPLLTRELLYTAVTRARAAVRVVGSEAAVRAAIERPVRRASGLRHRPGAPD